MRLNHESIKLFYEGSKARKILYVLKGIILDGNNSIVLTEILNNPIKYFYEFNESEREYLYYEEYLALEPFVLHQYSDVIIIENNIYYRHFPVGIFLSDPEIDSLCKHFDEDSSLDEELIGINPYLSIFTNMFKEGGQVYCTYANLNDSEKIKHQEMYELDDQDIQYSVAIDRTDVYDIDSEVSYLKLLNKINDSDEAETFKVSVSDLLSDFVLKRLKQLELVCSIRFSFIKIENVTINSHQERPELISILSRFWGYKEFRNLECYDLSELKSSKYLIKNISQSEIVTSILDQCEICRNNETFKDCFITAPTGSGKSVMFQVPAIFIAEKFQHLTIVISPLIGLMNDQVKGLEIRNYKKARTINSGISPLLRDEIIADIKNGECDILYISPETLLGRSDIEMLIGERVIGLLIIDESHIVTTWGKQFRPDYWYLGDHVKKLRKRQKNKHSCSFVIATFTATCIYGGIENMYRDTKESLNMYNPITYLGVVRRENIDVEFVQSEKLTNRDEYELRKFTNLLTQIEAAVVRNRRVLVYFPTVQLINRFKKFCEKREIREYVTIYHGQLDKFTKDDNFNEYYRREKIVMLATKAFGMGIDINDIEVVLHFAPTGNVCDYVQEIGRLARKPGLRGLAHYDFMRNDFKHINSLHGLSTIKSYQLVEVVRKILELFNKMRNSNEFSGSKRKNEILLDAESFAHVFQNEFDDGNSINKVKTAMLIIQKDFESRQGFSPFFMRPIPMFSKGYFGMSKSIANAVLNKYGEVLLSVDEELGIYSVDLEMIWEKTCKSNVSFAAFKYLLYSKSDKLNFEYKKDLYPSIKIEVYHTDKSDIRFSEIIEAIDLIFNEFSQDSMFHSIEDFKERIQTRLKFSPSKSETVAQILIATIKVYSFSFKINHNGSPISYKRLQSGEERYQINSRIEQFIDWMRDTWQSIFQKTRSEEPIYLLDQENTGLFKEILAALGLFESLGLIVFKTLGGSDQQISLYINSVKTLMQITDNPKNYKNLFLERIAIRHKISVEMLTFLYTDIQAAKNFWKLIEEYFLGKIPKNVIENSEISIGKSWSEIQRIC